MKNLLGKIYTNYNHRLKPLISNLSGVFWLNRQLAYLNNLLVDKPNGEVFRPVDREWDVLIVLDACRYDYYKEFFPDSGKRVSQASHSREYFQENFSSDSFQEVVYISANPHVSPDQFRQSTGRELKNVFDRVYHLSLEDWDETLGVVPPSALTEKALQVENKRPEKRKIIHFMQPHAPYINETDVNGFMDVINGDKSVKDLCGAYKRNIEVIMPELEKLKEKMSGKIVVTADHGELLGEYGMYSHPYGVRAKELREVPWHVIKDEEKEVETDEITGIDI